MSCRALLTLSIILVLTAGALSACAPRATFDAQHSPVLVSAVLESYNEGSEDRQFVKVTLVFDREVAVQAGYLPKVTIAGAVVDKGSIKVTQDNKEVLVLININKVRDGDLELRLAPENDTATSGITDSTGAFGAANKVVYALIPSGVTIQQTGANSIEVSHAFNIRGIAWLLLSDGGEPVSGSLLSGADTLDGAVALHGHEFLSDDAYDVAARLAETLNNHFGDHYEFVAEGKSVTARSLENPSSVVAITLYEYTLVV